MLTPITVLLLSAAAFAEPASDARLDCSTRPPEATPEALGRALEAYSQLEPEAFFEALGFAEQAFACAEGPISQQEQADLWLARGLSAWLGRDRDSLHAAFVELVRVDPHAAPPASLVAPGSAVDEVLAQVRVESLVEAEVVDATAVAPAQAESSAISEAPLPTVRRRSSRPLLVGGLAVGAVAGTSLLVSQRAADAFWAADEHASAQRAYTTSRVAGFTGYGAAGVSAGLVLGAVLVGRW
jgi:hypothetical protein